MSYEKPPLAKIETMVEAVTNMVESELMFADFDDVQREDDTTITLDIDGKKYRLTISEL